ncbi:ABC transporter substrate-binding protein [Microbacterium hydrothermale]|uniref:ABC transporter substrate-binding protein n=1 Tax=Microbacterium hydrothermale TaxID=857427 RepID=UPI0010A8AD19|nr:extracellular solute-binding protein [Microbacterium hydrothermale]
MKKKVFAGLGVVAVTVAALTGCSSSSESAAASCTNEILKPDAAQVSVWAWYPAFEQVVDLFNQNHDDVQICWTNAGQGNDEYTKFSTSIESGSGAPDVIMLEAEVLSSFSIRDALVDLSAYGAGDVEADYTDGAWKDVSSGDAVYAIPVDGGPMGMLYRQDILDQYGIAAPTTWTEFADAAQKLKDAGAPGVLANFPPNGRAFTQALFAQAGSKPFTYDNAAPTDIGIDVNDQGAKDVLEYWQGLTSKGLVATDEAFTADYNTKLVDGTYAIYVAAAWGPGYLQGLEGTDDSAKWRAAPIPQWDAANPVQVNWGGSTFAVTSQARDKEAAATVAKEVFGTEEAWKIGIEEAALFPLWKPILDSDYFRDLESPFFGGQQINKEVFLPAAAGYSGFTFSPFQNYAYDQLQQQVTAVTVDGSKDAATALDDLQSTLEQYATEQGFTIK